MTEARIRCCVEGCARSMKNPQGYSAWLCSRHWHCTDVGLRNKFRQVKRTYRRCRRRDWRRTDGQTRLRIMHDLGAAWDALVEDARIKTAMNVEGTRPRNKPWPADRQDPLDVAEAMNIAYGDGP